MILLEKRRTDSGEIAVAVSRGSGALTYWQDGHCQSEADASGVSYAPYIHAIYDLIHQTRSHTVLMIGCGGGTLGTMLARTGYQVTLVDVDPAAIEIARIYFALDGRVHCVASDGRDFLLQSTQQYDGIVIDAFEGHQIPPHLCTTEFFRIVGQHLKTGGVALMNVLVANDMDPAADQIAGAMSAAGLPTCLLDDPGQRDRNTIVIGGAFSTPAAPTVRVPPRHRHHAIEGILTNLIFRRPISATTQMQAAKWTSLALPWRRRNRSQSE